jgi:anti-sigma regulatory factor (Ser/Thr protein kinase)
VLNGRVLIERARGVLAERLAVDVDTALRELRRHAKRTGQPLPAAATTIVDGDHVTAPNGTTSAHDPVLLIRRFDIDTLASLRERVLDRMAVVGLEEPQQSDMLLAVQEAAVNAIRHGGGAGRLWLWRHTDTVWCEISDDGPGLPPGLSTPATPSRSDIYAGRGLWIITHLCPGAEITNTSPGLRVLLSSPLTGGPVPAPRG